MIDKFSHLWCNLIVNSTLNCSILHQPIHPGFIFDLGGRAGTYQEASFEDRGAVASALVKDLLVEQHGLGFIFTQVCQVPVRQLVDVANFL